MFQNKYKKLMNSLDEEIDEYTQSKKSLKQEDFIFELKSKYSVNTDKNSSILEKYIEESVDAKEFRNSNRYIQTINLWGHVNDSSVKKSIIISGGIGAIIGLVGGAISYAATGEKDLLYEVPIISTLIFTFIEATTSAYAKKFLGVDRAHVRGSEEYIKKHRKTAYKNLSK